MARAWRLTCCMPLVWLWAAPPDVSAEGIGAAAFLIAAFSPDGGRIVTAFGEDVCIWDGHSGRRLPRLVGHGATVFDARFAPGGRVLVAASADKTVRLWDAETGEERRRFPTPGRALRASVGGGDRVLARWESAGEGNRPAPHTSLWDAGSGLELARFALTAGATAAAFSPDGARLLVATSPDPLRDARTGRPAR